MKSCVLTINGGSSSIRFAVHDAGETPLRRLAGKIDRIGLSGTTLVAGDSASAPQAPLRLAARDHRTAVGVLLDWLEAQPIFALVGAIGHRVVHGMKHAEPERITPTLLAGLRRITPYDPDHEELLNQWRPTPSLFHSLSRSGPSRIGSVVTL